MGMQGNRALLVRDGGIEIRLSKPEAPACRATKNHSLRNILYVLKRGR